MSPQLPVHPLDPSDQPDGNGSRWVRLIALVVLAALIVASLAYLGARWASDGAGGVFGTTDHGQDLAAERDAAMSQARQFALRINTYGPSMLKGKKMPGYIAQVESVLTDSYKADFEKGASIADATVSQEGVKSSAKVYATGVAALGDGTATVLVAGQLDYAFPKTPPKSGKTPSASAPYGKPSPEPFRWEVQMDEVGGTWLVDSFSPAESGAVSTTTQGNGVQ